MVRLVVESPVIPLIACSVRAVRSLAVDCPRYAEAIYKYAEANGPEPLLKRHFDRPFFCQCFEYAFCLCLVLEAKGYREALGFLIAVRRNVSTHQHLIAHSQGDMKDFLTPFGRYWELGWLTAKMMRTRFTGCA